MGADREPGDTTTCRTPPSSRTSTAIRAAARALNPGVASPGSLYAGAGSSVGAASGAGSFGKVTQPVCHPATPHHLRQPIPQPPLTYDNSERNARSPYAPKKGKGERALPENPSKVSGRRVSESGRGKGSAAEHLDHRGTGRAH